MCFLQRWFPSQSSSHSRKVIRLCLWCWTVNQHRIMASLRAQYEETVGCEGVLRQPSMFQFWAFSLAKDVVLLLPYMCSDEHL